MEQRKINQYIPESISGLTDAEFLQFLYSERNRDENLNSYQGWNVWAVYGAIITIVCAVYRIISTYTGEIDRIRTLILFSDYLGSVFFYWNIISFCVSFVERKRAKDYKKIKHLKDVVSMPYLLVVTACSLLMALSFIIVYVVHGIDWNQASISWVVLAVLHLLICINVHANRNAIVWSVKEDIWFAKTWVMVTVSLAVFIFFWLIWKWSYLHITGPYIGKPEFELAICYTTIVMLVYLLLKIKYANRKSSEIDVLIDEFVYKGKSKENVYIQLRANQMGYGVLEICSQELYSLQKYSEIFKSQNEKLEVIKGTFTQADVDFDCLLEQIDTLKQTMDANDEWACRVDALQDKVDEIYKNVPELRNEEEFVKMLKIVGHMMGKGKEMNIQIRTVIELMEKFMNECKKEEI